MRCSNAMDLLQTPTIIGLLTVLFLIYPFIYKVFTTNTNNKSKNLPPQPSGSLPIIGHLRLVKRRRPLVLMLADLADELGPVYSIRLGARRIVILNSAESAKESYTTSDKALSNKPNSLVGELLAYNRGMIAFAPYGPYWRSVRKIASTELLSNSRLEVLCRAVNKETDKCISELHADCVANGMKPLNVEMMKWLGDLNYNVVLDMIVSKRYFGSAGGYSDAWKFRKAAGEFIRLLGVFVPSDIFPFLKWLDLGGYKKMMKATFKDLDAVMSALLKDHRERRVARKTDEGLDFMDIMISAVDDPEFSKYDQDTVIKATCMSLIMGGTHTTTTYLIWTMALLLNNLDVLEKVRQEIDEHVGKDRIVDQHDIKNLVYYQAAIKEAFRLCPAGEQIVSHEALEDCMIAGFQIPKGTYVAVNTWKLQRDPLVWPDPLEFKPERFLTTHTGIDLRGQHYELLPFRAGRRSCPGSSFTVQVMDLVLARFIQAFDIETPGNVKVEMNQPLGILMAKSIDALVTPRLAPRLYEPQRQLSSK